METSIPRQSSVGSAPRRTSLSASDHPQHSQHNSSHHHVAGAPAAPSSTAQAASSLAVLLREDPLLTKHELHISGKGEDAAFAYASGILGDDSSNDSISGKKKYDTQQRAQDALKEVDRKLALVESLAERVSRTSPDAVAGPLLKLHGYSVPSLSEDPDAGKEGEEKEDSLLPTTTTGNSTTLLATRERCDRLKRQGEVLEGVARRVESSLQRGLTRMDKATNRLGRVLQLSATLKMILRLQFESSKLEGFYLDDLRDLTRAAASVAVIEDLLKNPEFQEGQPRIDVVEAIRPRVRKTAAAVRKAAASLLEQHYKASATKSSAVVQLGATLQVYYHLQELPQAAWNAVDHALTAAVKVSSDFWSPTTLNHLMETAATEAKLAVGGPSGKKKSLSDANVQRALKGKLRDLRAEAAAKWASGIQSSALQVWNLHRVLSRKSDPVSRQVFVDVVAAAPIPERYASLQSNRPQQGDNNSNSESFKIFALYWERLCYMIGDRLKHILEYDNGKLAADAAALYPAVRAASIQMLSSLHDTMQAGATSNTLLEDPTTATNAIGVLGGSAALDDTFLKWSTMSESNQSTGLGTTSADTWTIAAANASKPGTTDSSSSTTDKFLSSSSTTSMTVVFQSDEWITLQGNHASAKGLFRLQQAFLTVSNERLCEPLQYMFPANNMTVDENGLPISHLPLLPSRYDIQKFDVLIRQELALADPRQGGGDLSAVSMIAENVVLMITKFCDQAQNAVSHVGEDKCLDPNDGSATEALSHDLKVSKIMNAMKQSLRSAPDKVFLEPYRPAVTATLQDAAKLCEQALVPAIAEIDKFVKLNILGPLIRALNRRVANMISRMHQGYYLSASSREGAGAAMGAGEDDNVSGASSSFVQTFLANAYESIAAHFLQPLPNDYAAAVASAVATFSIYTFVSNVTLLRPLTSEPVRLQITQDLADLELALEQFVNHPSSSSSGGSTHLSQISNGKPYAELRAVRQMLFWSGLSDQQKPATAVAKALLRESWTKEVRPSTLLHYLVSWAPPRLSSPHHAKHLKPQEYISSVPLIHYNGTLPAEDGESTAWLTLLACCDSYRQRTSAATDDQVDEAQGDERIAAILLALGPELLHRRRP